MTDNLRIDLRRARIHLNLLEQDATHPLEFLDQDSPTAPPLILRPGDIMHTAHSDVGVNYKELRDLLIAKLRRRVDELAQTITDVNPGFKLEEFELGDQTEA
ncbi:MAG TPA: hypothetical protein VIQ29_21200 [Ancylobacter sp.]